MLIDLFNAHDLYTAFTPIRDEVNIPSNLEVFAKAMSDHHDLSLKINTRDAVKSGQTIELNENKALVLLSGGIDSTWSIVQAQQKGYEVYALFVDGLNPTSNSRERKAVKELCDRLWVNLKIIKHHPSLKRLHRSEDNKIETPESLAKLPYALMLGEHFVREHRIGSVIVTVDQDPILDWFSDKPVCMETFLPFYSEYIGGEIKGLYPLVSKVQKVRDLKDAGL